MIVFPRLLILVDLQIICLCNHGKKGFSKKTNVCLAKDKVKFPWGCLHIRGIHWVCARKIRIAGGVDFDINGNLSYSFINFFSRLLDTHCNFSLQELPWGNNFEQKSQRGLDFAVCMKCDSEGLMNPWPLIRNVYEINGRIVLIILLLRVGFQALNLFCALTSNIWKICTMRCRRFIISLLKVRYFRQDYLPLAISTSHQADYEAFSTDKILSRCLDAETPKCNEFLNSLIWTFAPNPLHSGAKVIKVAKYLAVTSLRMAFLQFLKYCTGWESTSERFSTLRANSQIIRS